MLSTLVVLLGTTVDELAPPVYAAYPTGGPVLGGTVVTIVGKEFGRINTVGLNRVRCSWGDPRPWQQSVFATQQAEMDGWAPAESILPLVPPAYFTRHTLEHHTLANNRQPHEARRARQALHQRITRRTPRHHPSYGFIGIRCFI